MMILMMTRLTKQSLITRITRRQHLLTNLLLDHPVDEMLLQKGNDENKRTDQMNDEIIITDWVNDKEVMTH